MEKTMERHVYFCLGCKELSEVELEPFDDIHECPNCGEEYPMDLTDYFPSR